MTILVIGSTGQLARHLRDLWPEARFLGRAELDLLRSDDVAETIAQCRPSVIVNAAAYTAVDRAETEPELSWRVNAEGAATLARAASSLDVPLLHVSTDYVFDGRADVPYSETDPVNPLNAYGRSKLGGELAVAALCRRHWILRTSWVFSEYGSNFVKTMLRLAREGRALRVVHDQFGRPTYAGDLARLVGRIVDTMNQPETLPHGLHHAVGGPATSWHGFAAAIVDIGRRQGLITGPVEVTGVSTADYLAGAPGTVATRPARSVLQAGARVAALGVPLEWRPSLEGMLERLQR